MYIVSQTCSPISPHIMRFQNFWIYDLRPFHDFWRKTVLSEIMNSKLTENEHAFVWDKSVWIALLKIYQVHTFAPIGALEPFARDYHLHFKTKITSHSHDTFFRTLKRLGLDRMGHLKRLTAVEIAKRFGKAWADFMKGVLNPHHTPWPWQPFRVSEPAYWEEDLDDPSVDAMFILSRIESGLQKLSQCVHKKVQKIEIILIYGEKKILELNFVHPVSLSQEESWIRRLMKDQLFSLQLESSISRVGLRITSTGPSDNAQLSLFHTQAPQLALETLCRKLENQGVQVFKPSASPSYIPEHSWFRASPLDSKSIQMSQRAKLRPLIQFPPKAIEAPQGILKKTEQIEWCDENGSIRSRSYYMTRRNRYWSWVFQTEGGQWFEQGVIE